MKLSILILWTLIWVIVTNIFIWHTTPYRDDIEMLEYQLDVKSDHIYQLKHEQGIVRMYANICIESVRGKYIQTLGWYGCYDDAIPSWASLNDEVVDILFDYNR